MFQISHTAQKLPLYNSNSVFRTAECYINSIWWKNAIMELI